MYVDIRSDTPITEKQLNHVLKRVNEEYGKQGYDIRNMTLEIKFEDRFGRIHEPKKWLGLDLHKIFTFYKN